MPQGKSCKGSSLCGEIRIHELGGTLEFGAAMRRWDWRSVGGVLIELVAQSPDRNAENVCRMRAVAQAVPQGLKNQISFDLGHRPANQIAGDLLGGHGGLCRDICSARLVEPCAVRRKNPVDTYFGAYREQHRPMQ